MILSDRRIVWSSIALAAMGCSTLGAPKPPLSAGVGTSEHITAAPSGLELDVVVRPRFGNTPRLEVEVTASSDDLPRRFVVQKAWAGETSVAGRLRDVRARCDGGEATLLTSEDLGTHLGWTLPRRCKKTTLTYSIPAGAKALQWGDEYDVIVTPEWTSAIAETALLLPDCPDDTPARVTTWFDLGEAPGVEGVYSLGPGAHDTTTRAARHAYFAIGKFLRVTRKSGEITAEMRFGGTFAGFTEADLARPIADLQKVLDAESAMFATDAHDETVRLLVVGMPSPHGASHGTSLTQSAAIWIDGTTPWSLEDARLAAHELFHLYNGQVVRRAAPDERTYWLSEGFTEYYADELMLRGGAFTAHEWYEAIRHRVRAYETSRDVEIPNDSAELGWGGSAVQLPYLRGAVVAAYVDHAIHVASHGKRSLDDFMRTLVARARAGGAPLDQIEILHLLGQEIGDDALEVVKSTTVEGRRLDLPADVFGACLEVVGTGKDTDVRVRPGVHLDACMRTGR